MSDKLDDLILLEKLAAGGMAEVYRAIHQGYGGFEKVVAVKRILPHFASDEEFKNMFVMEANLSGLFMNPNIVQIYSNGESDGYLYLVMEFVDGRNVRQLLARCDKAKARIPIEYSCFVIAEAAKGLEYAHTFIDPKTNQAMNIIHRDMSPQNIMLSYDGSVKIVDFGIAKAAARSEHTKAGVLKGKFGYMSPEQANGMPIDHRTDIFALGIIFFELLTQRRLFSHDDDMRTLQLIRECNVPRPSKYNPSISPALDRIVLKALAKNRNERYQSSGEFYGDLQRFMNQKYPNFLSMDFAKFLKEKAFVNDIQKDKAKREALAADAPARLGKPEKNQRNLKGAPNKAAPPDKDATQVEFSDSDEEVTAISQVRDMASHVGEVELSVSDDKHEKLEISKVDHPSDHRLEVESGSESEVISTRITKSEEAEGSLPTPSLTSDGYTEPVLAAPESISEDLKMENDSADKKGLKLETNSAFATASGPSHLSLSMTMNSEEGSKPGSAGKIKSKPKAALKRSAVSNARPDLEVMTPAPAQAAYTASNSQNPKADITFVENDSASRLFRNPLYLLLMVAAGAGAFFKFTDKGVDAPKAVQIAKSTKAKDSVPPLKKVPTTTTAKNTDNKNTVNRVPASVRYSANGATGYLNIVSFPNATKIYVNGKILVDKEGIAQRSPANLQKIDVGTHQLRLVNDSLGMSWEGSVDIVFDSVKKLEVRMK